MNEELMKQYAEFAVRVGVNPQKGQTMLISCSVESAPFARLCARAAFEAGARDVVMKYTDEQFARIRMENASVEDVYKRQVFNCAYSCFHAFRAMGFPSSFSFRIRRAA